MYTAIRELHFSKPLLMVSPRPNGKFRVWKLQVLWTLLKPKAAVRSINMKRHWCRVITHAFSYTDDLDYVIFVVFAWYTIDDS